MLCAAIAIVSLFIGLLLGGRRPRLRPEPAPLSFSLPNSARADLRPLVDSLPDPVLLIDAQDRMALLNTAASRLLQPGSSSLIGRPFVTAMTDQAMLDLFDEMRNNPDLTTAQRELKLTRAGSRLTFQALALRNPDNSILFLLRDVTRLANIVQMKTDFVSNAGHELRTPVAAIKLALEVLRDEPTHDRSFTIIDSQMARLEEMLADLMDLSKFESPDFQNQLIPIRPSELFANISAPLLPLASKKGVTLLFEGPADDEPLNTDSRLLAMILKNLVENAIKFTPAGEVRTTIRMEPVASGTAEASGARSGASQMSVAQPGTSQPGTSPPAAFTLIVSDTGIGIPLEHHARIFERFYQVDPARTGSSARGTGLGLAIVKHAVLTLSGQVSVQSSTIPPNNGTIMTCSFPG